MVEHMYCADTWETQQMIGKHHISYFEASTLVSLGSDIDMADMGLVGGTWAASGTAGPAVEKEAAAAAMPAATQPRVWEGVVWWQTRFRETQNKLH